LGPTDLAERREVGYGPPVGTVTQMPPRGRYLAQEVGRLSGVSGGTIGQWLHHGYIRASQSESKDYPRVYSFQDAAEAILVHELLVKGVPPEVLRPTIEGLRETRGDWPLQTSELESLSAEGIPLASLLVKEGEDRFELGPHGWQVVEHTTVNPQRVAADLRRGGWAARELPDLAHVTVDPDFLSGRPTISGRRVPISLVAELAEDEDGPAILREEYDLSTDEINDALLWWTESSKYEIAA
jgi:uncharacterized protein (DUF433 family)/DNA-binding transcriptional MerR regulator